MRNDAILAVILAACAAAAVPRPAEAQATAATSREAPAPRPEDADQQISLLIDRTELQVSDGKLFVPAGDNAMDTVLEIFALARTATPAAVAEVAAMPRRLSQRAAIEDAAGRDMEARRFARFAEALAAGSGGRLGTPAPGAASPKAPPASATPMASPTPPVAASTEAHPTPTPGSLPVPDSVPVPGRATPAAAPASPGIADSPAAPATIQIASLPSAQAIASAARDAPPPVVVPPAAAPAPAAAPPPVAAVAPEVPARPAPPAPAPVPPPPAVAAAAPMPATPPGPVASQPSETLPPGVVAALLTRGDAMLALGNVSAARLLYERAALAGSAIAAAATARTYDPEVLTSLGAIGIRGDAAAAANWYRRAVAMGETASAEPLRRLEAGGAH